MWNNFKRMPVILKFLTAHAIACIVFFIGSVIPHDGFSINNQPVTYEEWWSSGMGVFASLVGISMPLTAWQLLNRTHYSRIIYMAAIFSVMVLPYIYIGQYNLALFGLLFVAIIYWYLYIKESTKAYFCSPNLPVSRA